MTTFGDTFVEQVSHVLYSEVFSFFGLVFVLCCFVGIALAL